jgi:ERCC4-type nuclease
MSGLIGCGLGGGPVKKTYEILVDNREKKPLPFPEHISVWGRDQWCKQQVVGLRTRSVRMDVGDYMVEGGGLVVERKGSLREVAQNTMSRDRNRFLAALDRLKDSAERAAVVLEETPSSIAQQESRNQKVQGAIDALMDELIVRDISLILVQSKTLAQRRDAARLVARLLIAGAL